MENKSKTPQHVLKPEELKYYVCLFQLKRHKTWHGVFNKSVEGIETHLKETKVTAKKFFEIDRLTGTFEEF